MSTQMNRTHGKDVFFVIAAWVALAGAASCLSTDDAPAGGRVEHPPQRAPIPVASAGGAQQGSPQPNAGSFTPVDQAIADDCPGFEMSRAWSRNVPDRDCTNDSECGDGFCDRGHCAAIWTCAERYGQRCINGRPVRSQVHTRHNCNGLCIDGRCRSCQADAECQEALGGTTFICNEGRDRSGGRSCMARGPKVGLDEKQAPLK